MSNLSPPSSLASSPQHLRVQQLKEPAGTQYEYDNLDDPIAGVSDALLAQLQSCNTTTISILSPRDFRDLIVDATKKIPPTGLHAYIAQHMRMLTDRLREQASTDRMGFFFDPAALDDRLEELQPLVGQEDLVGYTKFEHCALHLIRKELRKKNACGRRQRQKPARTGREKPRRSERIKEQQKAIRRE